MFSLFKRSLLALLVCASPLHALDIQFDYSLDTGGFFSGANIARRDLLEAAAVAFQTELSNTTWTPIAPGGGNTWTLNLDNPTTGFALDVTDSTVAASTLTIYIGARDLGASEVGLATRPGFSISGSQAWINLFDSKDTVTHFEPIGGSISFNSLTNWYFDPNPSTLEAFAGSDFFSVAEHEIGHLLGFEQSVKAFQANTLSGKFVGARTKELFGGAVPLSGDLSHWQNNLTFQGHALCMDPSLLDGTRTSFGPLDFSVLRDIGYATKQGTLSVVCNPLQGSVTAGFNGSTSHTINDPLSILATPKTGFLFLNWTGDLSSTANPFVFTMADGLSLTANFIPLPFVMTRYYGVLQNGATPDTNGNWTLNVSKLGVVTSAFVLNGRRVPVAAKLDVNGHATKNFLVGTQPATLVVDQNFNTRAISGTLTVNAVMATFAAGELPVFTALAPCPLRGNYTVAFQPEVAVPNPEPPQGSGYARVVIGVTGIGRITGKLADGTALALSIPLDKTNHLALSHSLAVKQETLVGTFVFPGQNAANDFDGSFVWNRLPNPGLVPRPWNAGFTTTLPAIGSVWTKPLLGFRVLSALDSNSGAADLQVSLGATTVMTKLVVSTTNIVLETPITANRIAFRVAPATGLFSGSYLDTSVLPNLRRPFTGVLLQKQSRGDGFVLKRTGIFESGPVNFTPTP